MTTQTQKTNKAGTKFCLVTSSNGERGLVHKLCSNYVRGSIDTTWRICNLYRQTNPEAQKMAREGMLIADAKALFAKKLKGSAK